MDKCPLEYPSGAQHSPSEALESRPQPRLEVAGGLKQKKGDASGEMGVFDRPKWRHSLGSPFWADPRKKTPKYVSIHIYIYANVNIVVYIYIYYIYIYTCTLQGNGTPAICMEQTHPQMSWLKQHDRSTGCPHFLPMWHPGNPSAI